MHLRISKKGAIHTREAIVSIISPTAASFPTNYTGELSTLNPWEILREIDLILKSYCISKCLAFTLRPSEKKNTSTISLARGPAALYICKVNPLLRADSIKHNPKYKIQ
jgi:hypothetical protein